jgi:serine/threonine protein kinase
MDSRMGKYELLEQLGAGGMAVVYRAWDASLGRHVALKVVRQGLRGGKTALKRFLQEAKIAAMLSHPNIVLIYELGVEQELPFIAMELLPGQDLRRILEQKAPLTLSSQVDLAMQVAAGLRHAHSRGVIHRDVKPANIGVLPDGLVKLMDFGIAKLTAADVTRLTRTGGVVGTVAYMSPEQLRGEPLTPASDVFSFGVVLYELLSGHNPFLGETNAETVRRTLELAPPPLAQPAVPADLGDLVQRCLNKSLEERFTDFEPVVAGLRRVAERLGSDVYDEDFLPPLEATGGAHLFPRTTQTHRLRGRIRPQRAVWLGLFVAAALAGGFGLWLSPPKSSSILQTDRSELAAPQPMLPATRTPPGPAAPMDRPAAVKQMPSQPAALIAPREAGPTPPTPARPIPTALRRPRHDSASPALPTPALELLDGGSLAVRSSQNTLPARPVRVGGAPQTAVICLDGRPVPTSFIGRGFVLGPVPAARHKLLAIDPVQGTAEADFEVVPGEEPQVVLLEPSRWRTPEYELVLRAPASADAVLIGRRASASGTWAPVEPPERLTRLAPGQFELRGRVDEEIRIQSAPGGPLAVRFEFGPTPDRGDIHLEAAAGAELLKRCVRGDPEDPCSLPPLRCGAVPVSDSGP